MTVTFATTIEKHSGDTVIAHTHACHEIVYYDEGCLGKATLGDDEYEFHGGDIAVIPQGVLHKEEHFSTGKVIFFGFSCDENEIVPGVFSNMFYLKYSFRDIINEVREQSLGFEEMMELSLRKILLCLKRQNDNMYHPVTNLTYCREYIEENFTQSVSLKNLASTSGYSYDYFRHLFTSVYGQSPSSLIMSLRVGFAIKLLSTTKLTCTEIAHQSGFFDSGQMTKLLKKKYGLTPSEIRKRKI